MARTSDAIQLRSGFIAIPVDGRFIFMRHHVAAESSSNDTIFVCNLPAATSETQLVTSFSTAFGAKVQHIQAIHNDASTALTLLKQELAQSSSSDSITRLFAESIAGESALSANAFVIQFDKSIVLPPKRQSALITRNGDETLLRRCLQRYQRARPLRSVVIAHCDEWMQRYDKVQSKRPSQGVSSVQAESTSSKSAMKKSRKTKSTSKEAAPGSAAALIAQHLQDQASNADKSADDDGWTLVTRGGQHGKSTLPEDARPSLHGYGSRNVKVSKRIESAEDVNSIAGVKQIAGDSFYRFKKDEARRKELEKFKQGFGRAKAAKDRPQFHPY